MIAKERKRVIAESTDLGIGMLIAESEDGACQPVAAVSTIRGAREMANGDMRGRRHRLERGDEPMYPARYLVWARGDCGEFTSVAEIEAD
jgi:hypothetical protein